MKTLKLIALIYIGWWAWGKYQGESITVPGAGSVEIQLNADSIRKIVEIAGASQSIEVLFDTSWVEKTEDFKLFGLTVDILEKDVLSRYSETRTWVVKAASEEVNLVKENGAQVIVLSQPVIMQAVELEDKFRVLHQTGKNWNPVAIHAHLHRSRRLAEQKAHRSGIEAEAAASINATLRNILPKQIQIRYE